MLSLKEIKEKLEQSTGLETWITELEQDERIGARQTMDKLEKKTTTITN